MEKKRKKRLLELSVNGELYELAVEAQETLLEVLRNHLGMTGTKEGCDTGECGTCTVLIDRKPVLSCLTLAVDCRGKEILTIEGLAKGETMSTVQEAFLEKGAVQCGFCTPGMVLATTALLEENKNPSDQEKKKALEGHLCRCTGYNKIIEAVDLAVTRTSGEET
ncbi:MAG: (2Fe-2S)-binding protein [Proteobacteria bacterium]|nr:(2Fe-2S)-binding protein [Desulfobacteraceae bacterium]MBU0734271.1 (2Fe-2S)-binding protein [Pseudomonadota bacterium]MBU1903284.1 (2Fe-2S)-binding protein [Pseudomonadota bacterium]